MNLFNVFNENVFNVSMCVRSDLTQMCRADAYNMRFGVGKMNFGGKDV